MPLIPQVGRKSWKARFGIALLYLTLSLGAVTMVYPFLLMLSTSLTSNVDQNDYQIIPRFLREDDALFRKYVEDKYSGEGDQMDARYALNVGDFRKLEPPKVNLDRERPLIEVWRQTVESLPPDYWQAGFRPALNGAPSLLYEKYQNAFEKKFGDKIEPLNDAYLEENVTFRTLFPPMERLTSREWSPDDSQKMRDWLAYKGQLSREYRLPVRADTLFQDFIKGVYRGDLKAFNAVWGTNIQYLTQARFPSTPPASKQAQEEWERFVRERLPFRYLHVGSGALAFWQEVLESKYDSDVAKLNELHGTQYASFYVIPMPSKPTQAIQQIDFSEFLKVVPMDHVKVDTVETRFADALRARFGTVEAMNAAAGTQYASFEAVSPPELASDYAYVKENASALRGDFAGRNYRLVFNYLFLHGAAMLNTVIYCSLAVLAALIVNPLCAYALSRYPMKGTYRVLLVILATMAFPAEVTMIPNFLLLKQLGLLNTYWALLLPSLAGPFMIFLLKGFFDSLPKELYEAGLIDGANELTMFYRLTVPLSKPIFAVIALQAFTAAYGAFMFAFLVCQDQSKWTMMVWLYQLQQQAPKFVTMSALTVAALPTLLIFILAQNVILRGIIIPTSK